MVLLRIVSLSLSLSLSFFNSGTVNRDYRVKALAKRRNNVEFGPSGALLFISVKGIKGTNDTDLFEQIML
uniref:Secreted protein n=1 Tax=Panstrongylus lignarius TaxID=156445 RepID=A0A224Y637_9HEMI